MAKTCFCQTSGMNWIKPVKLVKTKMPVSFDGTKQQFVSSRPVYTGLNHSLNRRWQELANPALT